jgi:hypothetical protein
MVERRELERIRLTLESVKSDMAAAGAAMLAQGVDTPALTQAIVNISNVLNDLEYLIQQCTPDMGTG